MKKISLVLLGLFLSACAAPEGTGGFDHFQVVDASDGTLVDRDRVIGAIFDKE